MITTFNVDELQIDTDIVKECMKEMVSVDRIELLESLTYQKLKEYNDQYIEKFDKMVDDLCADISKGDLKQIGKSLNRLSKATESIYNTEILLYKSLL